MDLRVRRVIRAVHVQRPLIVPNPRPRFHPGEHKQYGGQETDLTDRQHGNSGKNYAARRFGTPLISRAPAVATPIASASSSSTPVYPAMSRAHANT